MLTVVEDEQQVALLEGRDEAVEQRDVTVVWYPEGPSNAGEHEVWISYWGQVNKDDPVTHVLRNVTSDRHGQLRLAHAAGSSERQKGNGAMDQEGLGYGELRLAADEGGARKRERAERGGRSRSGH